MSNETLRKVKLTDNGISPAEFILATKFPRGFKILELVLYFKFPWF